MKHRPINTDTVTDIVEFVRLGQRVSRNFTVVLSSRVVFDAVMAAAMGANNFDPREVARTIGTLFDDAMKVEFGAKGSPVLYIEVPFFTQQRLAATSAKFGDRYTDEQRRAYTRQVITWARAMLADENSVQQDLFGPGNGVVVEGEPGEAPHRIRIWWE